MRPIPKIFKTELPGNNGNKPSNVAYCSTPLTTTSTAALFNNASPLFPHRDRLKAMSKEESPGLVEQQQAVPLSHRFTIATTTANTEATSCHEAVTMPGGSSSSNSSRRRIVVTSGRSASAQSPRTPPPNHGSYSHLSTAVFATNSFLSPKTPPAVSAETKITKNQKSVVFGHNGHNNGADFDEVVLTSSAIGRLAVAQNAQARRRCCSTSETSFSLFSSPNIDTKSLLSPAKIASHQRALSSSNNDSSNRNKNDFPSLLFSGGDLLESFKLSACPYFLFYVFF
jgi:hypothetical protein